MDFKIPENINFVLKTLEKAGAQAFIVGGCVRDMILGKEPDDFDVTTNALPERIVSLFEHTVCTGLRHGTVTVIIDNQPIEVTTYRTEGGYSDSRHPDSVKFVSRIDDDLARRDFTVNAICYNPQIGIVDPFDGRGDIEKHILRAVGDPDTRFKEDALRIMRLFRFCATLRFDIEKHTLECALKNAPLLQKVSRERIAVELKKTANAKNPAALSPLIDSGALEFLGFRCSDGLDKISKLEQNENLRIFALLYLCSSDMMQSLSSLKSSNALKDYCCTAKKLCTEYTLDSKINIKKALSISSPQAVYDIIEFHRMVLGKDTALAEQMLNEITENKEPYKISHLPLCGSDLINMGITGSDIGDTLNMLLEFVMENPNLNTKENLIEILKS